MTEYEILDLVASNEAHMASQFSLYLTVISAYLVVSYLVGERLTIHRLLDSRFEVTSGRTAKWKRKLSPITSSS